MIRKLLLLSAVITPAALILSNNNGDCCGSNDFVKNILLYTCRCTGHTPWNQPFEVPPGEFVDERSLMVSGMIPIILEVNGAPLRVIWINRDVNSPLAFRPLKYDMKVRIVRI